MEMPPLTLMVLNGLADDIESVESLRDHGEVAPFGLALVNEQDVVEALRALLEDGLVEALEDGLVEALEAAEPQLRLVPAPNPLTDDASLRRYWFQWTPAGERVWREGRHQLEAYWAAHPPGS